MKMLGFMVVAFLAPYYFFVAVAYTYAFPLQVLGGVLALAVLLCIPALIKGKAINDEMAANDEAEAYDFWQAREIAAGRDIQTAFSPSHDPVNSVPAPGSVEIRRHEGPRRPPRPPVAKWEDDPMLKGMVRGSKTSVRLDPGLLRSPRSGNL